MESECSWPIHKSPPLLPVLRHITSVRAFHSVSWIFIMTLLSHIHPGRANNVFPSDLPTKTLYAPPPTPVPGTCHAYHILLALIMMLLGTYTFSLPFYLVCLKPKYPLVHPIVAHPQLMVRPECMRPSFTPMQNNRQNYGSVYFNLWICGQKTRSRKILQRMVAKNSWVKYAFNSFVDVTFIC